MFYVLDDFAFALKPYLKPMRNALWVFSWGHKEKTTSKFPLKTMIMLQQLKELHDIQRHGRLDKLTAVLTNIQEES